MRNSILKFAANRRQVSDLEDTQEGEEEEVEEDEEEVIRPVYGVRCRVYAFH